MKAKSIIAVSLAMLALASCGGSKQEMPYAQQGPPARVLPPEKGDPVQDLVNRYTKEGFKSESMAFTMYEQIYSFREKLKGNADLVEIISDGIGATSFAAEQNAANAAAVSYATAAGSVIKGGMERDFGALSGNNTWDAFHGAFVQDVANYVLPLLKKEMKFSKKDGNGYVVRIAYTIDESKARDARRRAADEALENVGCGEAFGQGVRRYVDEMVEPNKQ